MLLHTHTFTYRGFYTEAFTQRLLHTEAFTQRLLRTEAFTDRDFYPQMLLHKCRHFASKVLELLCWHSIALWYWTFFCANVCRHFSRVIYSIMVPIFFGPFMWDFP